MPLAPRLERIQLGILFAFVLLAPNAHAQLVGTGVYSGTVGGTAESTVGLDFRVGDFFSNSYERLFEDYAFGALSVGETFEATVLNDPDFEAVVALLTNGAEDHACLHIQKSGSSVTECDLERFIFGLNRADFQGIPIRRITMEIAQLDIGVDAIDYDVIIQLWGDGPTLEPCPPSITLPAPGAILDNGCLSGTDETVWNFEWEVCEGATLYHLLVFRQSAPANLIDLETTENSYESLSYGYVSEYNLTGWVVRVRAMVDGEWGAFAERKFSVEAVDTDCQVATERLSLGAMKARY